MIFFKYRLHSRYVSVAHEDRWATISRKKRIRTEWRNLSLMKATVGHGVNRPYIWTQIVNNFKVSLQVLPGLIEPNQYLCIRLCIDFYK